MKIFILRWKLMKYKQNRRYKTAYDEVRNGNLIEMGVNKEN